MRSPREYQIIAEKPGQCFQRAVTGHRMFRMTGSGNRPLRLLASAQETLVILWSDRMVLPGSPFVVW